MKRSHFDVIDTGDVKTAGGNHPPFFVPGKNDSEKLLGDWMGEKIAEKTGQTFYSVMASSIEMF